MRTERGVATRPKSNESGVTGMSGSSSAAAVDGLVVGGWGAEGLLGSQDG
jgi:hypothetical protein